ncbi:MAG TPA: PAS domain-containing protein, partial [Polyangiaceae bacterium]|nr:PAS domain-containing protein [Polyangiaceae bacterium]
MASIPSPHQAQGPPANALLLRALVQRLPLGVVIWRLNGSADPASATLVAANPAASTLARIDFSLSIGRTLGDLFPAAVANGGRAYAEVAASGVERHLDAGVYPELGESVVSGSIVPLPDTCVGVVFEIEADQRRLDRERRKLNAFLDSIVDNIPAMVFVKDAEHLRYELFNLAGESLSGFSREEVYGKDDQQLFPKDVADFFQAKDREVLREGRMLDIPEEPLDTRAGRRWLHTKKIPLLGPDGAPQHLLGISLDITDRKLAVEALRRAHEELEIRVLERTSDLVKTNARLQCEIDERRRTQEALVQAEEQLRHSQKMEAIGKLAGGIAHDFNNLLSVIICYASILSAGLDPDSKLAQGLHEVKRAGERASDLTRQLLAFSRQQVLAPQVVDVNEVIGGMDKMLRRVIGEDLELRTTRAAGLGRIRADPGQLEQVIMNL